MIQMAYRPSRINEYIYINICKLKMTLVCWWVNDCSSLFTVISGIGKLVLFGIVGLVSIESQTNFYF